MHAKLSFGGLARHPHTAVPSSYTHHVYVSATIISLSLSQISSLIARTKAYLMATHMYGTCIFVISLTNMDVILLFLENVPYKSSYVAVVTPFLSSLPSKWRRMIVVVRVVVGTERKEDVIREGAGVVGWVG